MIRKPDHDFGNNQQIGTFLLNRACLMIAKKKFSAAYEFVIDAYDYIIDDERNEIWTSVSLQGEATSLHSLAFFSSLETTFSPRKLNIVDALFDEQSSKMCFDYESDFVRAFCHTVIENRVTRDEGDFIIKDGVAALNRYLEQFPKSEKALYLKAKLIYESSSDIESRESEALSLLKSALTLKKSPRSLFLKAKILENQQERNDKNYQNDEPVLIILDLCISHMSCLKAWELLHKYASKNRGIILPNSGDNKKIYWFDSYNETYFLDYLKKALTYSFHERNLTSSFLFSKEIDYTFADITKERQEIRELITVLASNKNLFSNDSYKHHIDEHNRMKDEAERRMSRRTNNYFANGGYDTENSFYNEDLDMDQQSQEYWDSI